MTERHLPAIAGKQIEADGADRREKPKVQQVQKIAPEIIGMHKRGCDSRDDGALIGFGRIRLVSA